VRHSVGCHLIPPDVISLETGGGSGDAGVPGWLRRREARGAGGEAAPAPEAQVSQSNR